MDEKLTYKEIIMQEANKETEELNETNTNGIRELALIEKVLNENWNDQNGQNAISNLKIFQTEHKNENNVLFDYKKAIEKATLGAASVGSSIDINATNVENQIEKSKTSVSAPIQSAVNLLNQAAGLAPKFAGDINGAISQLQTATTSMGELGKDVTIKFAKIRKVEQDLSSDLDNIDFNKVSTSIDAAQRDEYISISKEKQEKYWKDCKLEPTGKEGIYLAIKDGVALGYVKVKDKTKITTEAKVEDKNEANVTTNEKQVQKEVILPSSAQVEIDKYERAKAKKEQEEKMKNYVPSSAQVEMDKARKAGIKVPIAGAINVYRTRATGNKSIDELREQFGLYDENGNRNISNKFGYYNKSLTETQTQVLNKMDIFGEQKGLSDEDMRNWTYIVGRESGFKPTASNGSHHGLGQLSDGNIAKYAPSGDYKTNIDTQISATYNYILDRYGSISKARKFWDSHGWY